MKTILTLLTSLLLAPLAALHAADNTPYPVAKFSVEHAVINEVYPAWSPKMGYNHDSDITLFKGCYVAVWNANPEIANESEPGQLNYLSVSDDFQKWSVPVALFTSNGGASNPVDSTGMSFQWQPNFIDLRNETLFFAWCVKLNQWSKIDSAKMQQLARLFETFSKTSVGSGSLLDNRGKEIWWGLRMNEVERGDLIHHEKGGALISDERNPVKAAHPDWLIRSWWWQGVWNYAVKELRGYARLVTNHQNQLVVTYYWATKDKPQGHIAATIFE